MSRRITTGGDIYEVLAPINSVIHPILSTHGASDGSFSIQFSYDGGKTWKNYTDSEGNTAFSSNIELNILLPTRHTRIVTHSVGSAGEAFLRIHSESNQESRVKQDLSLSIEGGVNVTGGSSAPTNTVHASSPFGFELPEGLYERADILALVNSSGLGSWEDISTLQLIANNSNLLEVTYALPIANPSPWRVKAGGSRHAGTETDLRTITYKPLPDFRIEILSGDHATINVSAYRVS